MMLNLRKGLIVWMYSLRGQKELKKFGNIYYISKRMKYAVMYVDMKDLDKAVDKISRMKFVKKVEFSYRDEIDMDFEARIGASSIKDTVYSE
ncbi:YlbG family protein [Lactobacillus sp. YT155]|uniref:YlbG family protein n=1 Tax=Lactobacillus sp. YT155 TaxID=3060955 RepID=UPI00265E432E|nr:YlbG family protein [Lactobacillus sp. YT155]MDO1605305.1 YlbG family protein [Lactobacillus sp. YT155]